MIITLRNWKDCLFQYLKIFNQPCLTWNWAKQSNLHQTTSARPFSAASQVHPFEFFRLLSWLKSQFISFSCFSLTFLLNRHPNKIDIIFIFGGSLFRGSSLILKSFYCLITDFINKLFSKDLVSRMIFMLDARLMRHFNDASNWSSVVVKIRIKKTNDLNIIYH